MRRLAAFMAEVCIWGLLVLIAIVLVPFWLLSVVLRGVRS